MRFLLTTSALGVLASVLSTPAAAEQVISTALTTPQSTAVAGQDIRISSTGSVKPASGAAVTIDSNNSITNEGGIGITGANNATGILANSNLSGNITNTGTITIDENYTPTDSDKDGDLDGPFALGTNRFGIHVKAGGTFTGNVVNGGTITVEGNNSAGIAIDSRLAGSLTMSKGTIAVTGNDSVGIRAGDITGNVTLINGSVAVQGANSTGVALTGDVGGTITIQNSVAATGYRYTTPPADTSKLDADDLLQGGPAVLISGNVAHGIVFDAPPADTSTTNTDEDNDGIADAQEGTAAITSYGSAPAVAIGSSSADTTIGVAPSSSYGIVTKGTITGSGVYSGVSATGFKVGGLGHHVTVAGGMTVGGSVSASAIAADATALRIGSGASLPVLNVTGAVQSLGGGTSTTGALGVAIDAGASVGTIQNKGLVLATRNGTSGSATAIVDKSGSVTLVKNSGAITVTDAGTLGESAIAVDLRANTTGAEVRQVASAAVGANAPSITGNLLFGTGNDTLDAAAGTIDGAARFGNGDNQLRLSGDTKMTSAVEFGSGADEIQMAGTSVLNGSVDFGGGADSLILTGTSAFRGTLSNSASATVNVGAGATLDVTGTGAVNLASLTTGAGSTLGVTLNQGTNAVTLYNVSGAASFGTDTNVKVNLQTLGGVAGTYKIIQAGTLSGADNLTTSDTSLPFLYAANLVTGTPGQVSLQVQLKSAQQLGLNASETSILKAVVGAADSDAPVAQVFLNTQDSTSLRASLQQMLPDHAGGAFENATKGSRLTAEILADPHAPVLEQQGFGVWAQQVAWGESKSIGDTSSYKLSAWGAAGGIERNLGFGSIGVMGAYYSAKDSKSATALIGNEVEGGIYWRANLGGLHAFARGTLGHISFDNTRYFDGSTGSSDVKRSADGKWGGTLTSATAGLSYELRTGRLSVRPNALLEYYQLKEDSYSETGGGSAFDLIVANRNSTESAATGNLTVGYDLLATTTADPWMRLEVEGGRREILSGTLGKTVAHFEGGDDFTLTPEARTSGWRGALRLVGGGSGVTVSGEVNGEEQQGHASIGGRAGVQIAF